MKVGLSGGGEYVASSLKSRYQKRPVASPHNRRLWLAGYGIFAAILFVGFVIANFPYADTISALVAPIRMKVVFQRQAINFPIGARLKGVRLLSLPNEQLLLQSPEVIVAPRMGWLFLGRPSVKIHAQIYGGVLDANVHRHAGAVVVDFELESLNLAQMIREAGELMISAPTWENGDGDGLHRLGVTLSGELSGSGSAQVTGPYIVADRASVILFGRHVKAVIVNGLPPLDLGVVHAKMLLARGVAILQDVRASGSDGTLEMNGRVQLAPDITHSTIQLSVSLAPTPKGQASFGLLLNMLPHTPSDGPYHIQGALTSPSVS